MQSDAVDVEMIRWSKPRLTNEGARIKTSNAYRSSTAFLKALFTTIFVISLAQDATAQHGLYCGIGTFEMLVG